METTTTTRPMLSLTAARWSIISSAVALLALTLLHLLSPEFVPLRRMVSEYALGDYRWLLSLMFLAWALSCVTLFVAIRSHISTLGGKIGLAFLLISALGMGMASVFDVRYALHGVAALIGIPTLPIAAMLISVSLLRNPSWLPARGALLWTANLTWVSLAFMLASVFVGIMQDGSPFGPQATIGVTNRLLVVAYCVWLITAAWWAERL